MNKNDYPKLQKMKLSELNPAPYNPRKISSDALGRLTKSLHELGNLQPITWNAKTGNIEIGGLLLCKAPEGKVKQREEYFQNMAESQMESVDNNFLKQNDPRMPVLQPERSTRTTFGRS